MAFVHSSDGFFTAPGLPGSREVRVGEGRLSRPTRKASAFDGSRLTRLRPMDPVASPPTWFPAAMTIPRIRPKLRPGGSWWPSSRNQHLLCTSIISIPPCCMSALPGDRRAGAHFSPGVRILRREPIPHRSYRALQHGRHPPPTYRGEAPPRRTAPTTSSVPRPECSLGEVGPAVFRCMGRASLVWGPVVSSYTHYTHASSTPCALKIIWQPSALTWRHIHNLLLRSAAAAVRSLDPGNGATHESARASPPILSRSHRPRNKFRCMRPARHPPPPCTPPPPSV